MRTFLFFDFEVFKYNWLCVIKNSQTQEVTTIWDDQDRLKRFFETHKNDVFCGYNNKYYDNYIYQAIIDNKNPYSVSIALIKGINGFKLKPWELGLKKATFISYDLMNDLTTINAKSLKENEYALGLSIEETPIDFDIDKVLDENEKAQVQEYCIYDVLSTEIIFEKFQNATFNKLTLIKEFGFPITDLSKTSAQLTAKVLGCEMNRNQNDYFEYEKPEIIQFEKYKEIDTFYTTPIALTEKYKLKLADLDLIFGVGGLHGAIKNYVSTSGKLLSVDVVSFYPYLMILYDALSRSVKDKSSYSNVIEKRAEYKRLKEEHKALSYKLVIVTTYGAMDNKFNPLYDPKMRLRVSILGQQLLLMLIEKIEPYCKIVQVNTDGLIVEYKNDEDKAAILDLSAKWESLTRLNLEYNHIASIFQKDVNNYVYIDDKNKVKTRGGYVAQYEEMNYNNISLTSNDARVVDLAVVEYFTKNTPIDEFIKSQTNLILFQILVKRGPMFSKCKIVKSGQDILIQKVNRIFATTKEECGGVYKLKDDSWHKIAGSPEKCFLWNKNLKDLDPKIIDLDYNWYIQEAQKRINDFLGIKPPKKKREKKEKIKNEKK